MYFKTFRNVFRNLIKLDNLRVAQKNTRFTFRTDVSGSSYRVARVSTRARARPLSRPSSSPWNVSLQQALSRLFTFNASCNGGAGSLLRSVGGYMRNFRRFSTLPMFGAFAYAYSGTRDTTREPYRPDIADLFDGIKQDINKEPKAQSPMTPETSAITSLDDYEIKERLGQPSSCAAIYSAVHKNHEFALKIMFNYEFASNSYALQKGFYKECRVVSEQSQGALQDINCLPHHPNIIQILNAFDEETPCPQDAIKSYPHALPPRLSTDGYGRNRTLCLVMPKYDCTLKEYIMSKTVNEHESLLLFAQLLEGITHLVDNNEAHRDLKSDNILLSLRENHYPQLVITDFGCCLADENLNMRVPFESMYVDRGGNSALMAPEIASMKPGPGKFLDFSKSDVWACGALAYEIFGFENPFTNCSLDSRFYEDDQLPQLPSVSPLLTKLVHLLLRKDPSRRPSALEAVTMAVLLLYAPNKWFHVEDFYSITQENIETWLLTFCLVTMGEERRFEKQNVPIPAELILRKCFLLRANTQLVISSLAYLHDVDE